MIGSVPHFIELTLTNGKTFHLPAGDADPAADLDQWAKRTKRDWIETVEGVWVNPEQIVSAMVVALPAAPTGP